MGEATDALEQRNARRGLWGRDFTFLYLTSLASFLGFQLLVPTLPLFLKGLGGQDAEVGLILGIFSIAALAARLLAGRLLDKWGSKWPLVAGVVLTVAAMLLYNFTTTVFLLILLRFFHGIGFGIVTTASPTLTADLAPPSRCGEAMGFYGNTQSIATGIGPVLGLWLISAQGLPLHGFPMLFVVCAAFACIQLLTALPIAQPIRPAVPQTAPAPGRSSFFSRDALPTAMVMFFATFAFGAVLSFVPIYLSSGQDTQILSVFFLVNAFVAAVSLPIIGGLADRIGRRKVAVPLLVLWPIGVVVLAISPTLPVAVASAVLGGLGFGALMPTLMAHVVDVVRPEERGAAMATFMAAVDIGIALGSMVLGLVVQAFGFQTMFMIAAGVAALGLASFLMMPRAATPGYQPAANR